MWRRGNLLTANAVNLVRISSKSSIHRDQCCALHQYSYSVNNVNLNNVLNATTMNKILFCSNVNVSEHFLATSRIFLYSKMHDEKNLIEVTSQDSSSDSRHWGNVGKV